MYTQKTTNDGRDRCWGRLIRRGWSDIGISPGHSDWGYRVLSRGTGIRGLQRTLLITEGNTVAFPFPHFRWRWLAQELENDDDTHLAGCANEVLADLMFHLMEWLGI